MLLIISERQIFTDQNICFQAVFELMTSNNQTVSLYIKKYD